MLRMTDMLRNRRAPRKEIETPGSQDQRLDRSRNRDIARLYTTRIWL